MILTSGATSVYRSIRPPTAEERQGARPPAVSSATVVTGIGPLCQFNAIVARPRARVESGRSESVAQSCDPIPRDWRDAVGQIFERRLADALDLPRPTRRVMHLLDDHQRGEVPFEVGGLLELGGETRRPV